MTLVKDRGLLSIELPHEVVVDARDDLSNVSGCEAISIFLDDLLLLTQHGHLLLLKSLKVDRPCD